MIDSFLDQKESLLELGIFYDLDPYNEQRCLDLYRITKDQAHVEGDMAQCGVYFGLTSYFIAKNYDGTIHLFDSWRGISEPSDKDNKFYEKGMWSTPLDDTKKVMAEFSNIRYHRGWIPKTLSLVANKRFSMVHLDLDLYQPTLDCLEFFWDRMSPGGLIVCDNHKGFSVGVITAVEEFFGHKDFTESESGQIMIYKTSDSENDQKN